MHEDQFAAYRYHNVRAFHEYSNTPLEGTNNALKHCTLGVKGNMSLQHSSVNMMKQDSNKLQLKNMELHAELHKQRLCSLDGVNGRYISKSAFGQLTEEWQSGQNYASLRTSGDTWSVLFAVREDAHSKAKVIPVFRRMRQVIWNLDHTLSCDCGYTNRWGMPCRHMAHVVQRYTTSKRCFTHHDVDMRWWNIYSKFMVVMEPLLMNDAELNIRRNLTQLYKVHKYPVVNCIHHHVGIEYAYGDNVHKKFKDANVESAGTLFARPKWTVLNYPEEESSACDVGACNAGITQTTNAFNDSDSECNIENDNSVDICDHSNDLSDQSDQNLETVVNVGSTQGTNSRKRQQPFEIYAPLFKEINALSERGVSEEQVARTAKMLESVVNGLKEYHSKKVRTPSITARTSRTQHGTVLSSTMPNNTGPFVRYRGKRQKLYRG